MKELSRAELIYLLWSRVDWSDGPGSCWPFMGARDDAGYGRLRRGIYAHRLAYELGVGPLLPGVFVCHSCDNPPCCNPSHLFAGSHADNMRDMRKKGRSPQNSHGERAPMARFTDADVLAMRRLSGAGMTYKAIAEQFGASVNYVGYLVRGQRRTRASDDLSQFCGCGDHHPHPADATHCYVCDLPLRPAYDSRWVHSPLETED